MRGAHLRTVAELDDQRDQVDDHGDEQLGRMVEICPVDLTQKETEVQGAGQDREERKDDLSRFIPGTGDESQTGGTDRSAGRFGASSTEPRLLACYVSVPRR